MKILSNSKDMPKKDYNNPIKMTFNQWLNHYQNLNNHQYTKFKPYGSSIDYFFHHKKDGYNTYGVII
jgi:hypothetical protein